MRAYPRSLALRLRRAHRGALLHSQRHDAGQFQAFAECLNTGAGFPVTMDDSRQAIELLTAFFLSADTNLPVDLPIPPDHPYYTGWLPKT